MDNQKSGSQPFSMPGPKFSNNGNKNWFSRHSQTIVLSLIVILIAVGGFYFYKSYQQRRDMLRAAILDIQKNADQQLQEQKIQQQPISPSKPQTPEVKKVNGDFSAKAVKGNGATHLARETLKQYLANDPALKSKLSAEHRIYIEDYLQKHSKHDQTLHPGDEITFSDKLIKEAIDKALQLNQKQLNNLSKYVPSVPSVNY